MKNRETALRSLAVGDMFHGRSPNGASLICLVTSVSDNIIYARRITTQDDLQFDRRSGIELSEVRSRIDCVAPFPADLYGVFLELDRKGQVNANMLRNGIKPSLDQYRLTPEERRALLVIDEHISANPI
jgi:hypothetical protein